MCETVFAGLCQIVGASKPLKILRCFKDFEELVDGEIANNDGVIPMESGSRREGFRLEGSDIDIMFWLNNYRVIWDLIQFEDNNTATKNLILADCSMSQPGFTLLESLTLTTYSEFKPACVKVNDRIFISSSLFRRAFKTNKYLNNSKEHGPCERIEIMGEEFDMVLCFSCDIWPSAASSWIERCRFRPEKEVVSSIVRK